MIIDWLLFEASKVSAETWLIQIMLWCVIALISDEKEIQAQIKKHKLKVVFLAYVRGMPISEYIKRREEITGVFQSLEVK